MPALVEVAFVLAGWPNERGTKQFHLDLACEDVAATEARAVELGATVLDPAGHPFCLTSAAKTIAAPSGAPGPG